VMASCTGISPCRAAKVYCILPKSQCKGADPLNGPLRIPTLGFTTLRLHLFRALSFVQSLILCEDSLIVIDSMPLDKLFRCNPFLLTLLASRFQLAIPVIASLIAYPYEAFNRGNVTNRAAQSDGGLKGHMPVHG
jgi:hypothetical protein